ncbi:Plasma membrane ATPase [Balamuthia mandrillaris]
MARWTILQRRHRRGAPRAGAPAASQRFSSWADGGGEGSSSTEDGSSTEEEEAESEEHELQVLKSNANPNEEEEPASEKSERTRTALPKPTPTTQPPEHEGGEDEREVGTARIHLPEYVAEEAPRKAEEGEEERGGPSAEATKEAGQEKKTTPPLVAKGATSELIKNATIDQVLEHLHATREGLTNAEVQERLAQYGPNKLPEHKVNPLFQFLFFFWNPLSWAMEFAAVLAIVLGDYVDFILILALLVLNAVIGFWEDHSSSKAVDALKGQLAPMATCRRNGTYDHISAFDLVPGDIVKLASGDVVPADVKLLEGESIKLDQAALTGESLPVNKGSGEEVFAGSTVKEGRIDAVVYATGANTFFGRAASLVAGTEEHGHFQRVLKRIGLFCISIIVVGVATLLIIQFAIKGEDCTGISWTGDACPPLDGALVLIVGGIPIAMPTVLSVTMALGASMLAKKQAIVARLTAVEEMAGMDRLCSDKTGTLTLNKLTMGEPFVTVEALDGRAAIFHAALAAQQLNPDAVDTAMLGYLTEEEREQLNAHEQVYFKPFDPVSKKSSAIIKAPDGSYFKAIKGAPQVILLEAANRDEINTTVTAKINEFAARGFRALGVARAFPKPGTDPTQDQSYPKFIMEGLLPLYDPPRHDTREVIEKVKHYGIKVKMITGDQTAIAVETARSLGMGLNILTPNMLEDPQSPLLVEEADGFAQVFPEHKYDIVERLQRLKHIVGMTGDGVNDAPALKKADIGIAVADATDAARAAADIVLLSPGLGVIVDAILGSRKIFQRMRNYTIYSIASTVRIVLTFTLLPTIFDFYFPVILTAILALLNDGTILTISKDRVKPSQEPDVWNLPRIFVIAIVIGLYLTASTVVLFIIVELTDWFEDWFGLPELSEDELRGLIYIQVSISSQSTIFITRSQRWFFSSRPSILLVIAFILAQVAATVLGALGLAGYPSDDFQDFRGSGWGWALLAWIWCIIWFFPLDILKRLTYYLVSAVIKAKPIRRTRRFFGHPVYGKHGVRQRKLTNVWPSVAMEPPSIEDVSRVASVIHKHSFATTPRPTRSMAVPHTWEQRQMAEEVAREVAREEEERRMRETGGRPRRAFTIAGTRRAAKEGAPAKGPWQDIKDFGLRKASFGDSLHQSLAARERQKKGLFSLALSVLLSLSFSLTKIQKMV